MSRQIAIRLLSTHRDALARSIVQTVERYAPSMQGVDRRARIQSVSRLIDGMVDALTTGDATSLSSLARGITRLRAAGGVPREDLVASTHCYLPCARRLFLQHCDDAATALSAYDEVEAVVLPVVIETSRLVLAVQPVDEDDLEPTSPGKRAPPRVGARGPFSSEEEGR